MKKQKVLAYSITLCACMLIALFLYTAIYKLVGYSDYVESMNRQPLPKWSIMPLIWILPVIEIFASLLLFFYRSRFWGFLISLMLMTAFTAYIALALANVFGHIPCSCGGAIQSLSWPQHLVFNIVFLSIALIGLVLCRRYKNLEQAIAYR